MTDHHAWNFILMRECCSDRRSEAMFLVRISNELQIATFNRQLSDFIGQYSAINLIGDLMDDQSLIGDGKTVIEMISDQVPKLIGDKFDRPSNVHVKSGPKAVFLKPYRLIVLVF